VSLWRLSFTSVAPSCFGLSHTVASVPSPAAPAGSGVSVTQSNLTAPAFTLWIITYDFAARGPQEAALFESVEFEDVAVECQDELESAQVGHAAHVDLKWCGLSAARIAPEGRSMAKTASPGLRSGRERPNEVAVSPSAASGA